MFRDLSHACFLRMPIRERNQFENSGMARVFPSNVLIKPFISVPH